ncbi:MAG: hypothetical protein WCI95_01780 [bacterium]
MSALGLEGRLKPIIVGAILLMSGNAGVGAEEDGDADLIGTLRGQVRFLSAALVAAKIEIDGLKARLDTRAGETADATGVMSGGSAMVREKEYLILDVNKELGMVILNGGHRDGVKPGLVFNVITEDKSVTTVRVVDARSAIAGAVIQNRGRELPKVQDRAVLAAGSKN